ncbi:uroporphyrinogen-III C-methyltransferase [Eggerthellaceae bacterium zg-1084]|uniref:uroporphyrinogen-III C-methyltransferase n=1 Tax=Berryella wangjianweii TaxID=2734634 RepID=A0A6M8J7Z3_9ACTN|nr:uroporphyrinogen-III C-methyltransferase [Berryella wangjianweii]NPD31035.1 uroporphyrinogen-III C-methyltransferase [Berryella wangjianweii]QKF07509.1 uroporphyrinogen-III C-methyltransferase [Berryella wangjianweii]
MTSLDRCDCQPEACAGAGPGAIASLEPCRTLVALVGAGPGDGGLITVRGRELLSRADCVVYDYLSNDSLVKLAPAHAEVVYVGKKGFEPHIGQEGINRILIEKARELDAAHERAADVPHRAEQGWATPLIVRLKGGDPFVFGRGGEEALALREAGIPFEVVPGVTSGVAAPAYAGIPVTHRGVSSSVTFVTGHEDPEKNVSAIDWQALAALASKGSTVCFYMGMRNLGSIAERLRAHGCAADLPVALVSWGTTVRQRSLSSTLDAVCADAAQARMEAPVMIVVGRAVSLRDRLAWFEQRPLFGKRVLVTRTRSQAGALSRLLEQEGAQAVELPVIEVAEPQSPEALMDAACAVGSYQWVAFTSVNGVERFFDALSQRAHGPRDARALGNARVAAIGPATAQALRVRGVVPDALPDEYRAEAVHDALREAGLVSGDRVLIPRAREARETLPEALRALGCTVDVVEAYRTVMPSQTQADELVEQLRAGLIDAVTFTSSSTVRNFLQLLGNRNRSLLEGVGLFSIGPITSDTMRAEGLAVTAQADEYTIPGLVACMVAHGSGRGAGS